MVAGLYTQLITVDVDKKVSCLIIVKEEISYLTIIEPDCIIARFPLTPDNVGIEIAHKIADALNSWAEHAKRGKINV